MMAGYNLMILMLVGVPYFSCNPTPVDELTINLNLLDKTEDEGSTAYETLDEDLEMKAGQVSETRSVVIGGYDEKGVLQEKDEVYVPSFKKWLYAGFSLPKSKRRAGMGIATLNNEIYIAGGLGNDKEKTPLSSVLKRPLDDNWQDLPNLQINRAYATLTTVEILFDGKLQKTLVIAGGQGIDKNPMKSTEFKSPENDNWYPNPPMIEARSGHAAVLLNAKIYVLGGRTEAANPSETTEFFNTKIRTWNVGPPMIEKRSRHAATVLGETIYICGGQKLEGKSFVHLQSCEYGNGQEPFAKLADMEKPRSFFAMLTVDGEMWAIGGYNGDGKEALDTVEIYDPTAQMWNVQKNEKLNKPRWVFGATTVIRTP